MKIVYFDRDAEASLSFFEICSMSTLADICSAINRCKSSRICVTLSADKIVVTEKTKDKDIVCRLETNDKKVLIRFLYDNLSESQQCEFLSDLADATPLVEYDRLVGYTYNPAASKSRRFI